MSFNIGKGRGQLHELPDQLATLRSLTKYSERIPGPAAAPAMVTDAFRAMLTGRPGPATLEAAWDHLGARGPVDLDIDRSIPTAPAADPATSRFFAAFRRVSGKNKNFKCRKHL